MNVTRRALLLFAIALGTIGCDQGTKVLATSTLRDHPPVVMLGSLVKLFYAENPGAFGSLGAAWPEALKLLAFVILPVAVLLAMAGWVLWNRDVTASRVVAFALIVGGGIGNLIDRVMHGSVVDFMWIGIGRIGTNVFNVADVALMVGIALVVFERRRKAETG